MWGRLKHFVNPFDARFEDMKPEKWHLVVLRDFSAGLIVAMMAIPLAMGFAIASGLKPEQGIVGGAVAGLVGALFGGSKYQVYGPTAAFIPVIAGFMAMYAPIYGQETAHGMLVVAAIIAGLILVAMGVGGLGKLAKLVPHSIVVGFTIGIAVTIGLSQIGEALGLHAGFQVTDQSLATLQKDENVPKSVLEKLEVIKDRPFATHSQFRAELAALLPNGEMEAYQDVISRHTELRMPSGFFKKLRIIWEHRREFNGDALLLALMAFLITRYLLRLSIYIPAPLIAIGAGILMSFVLHDRHELKLIGKIPSNLLVFTGPAMPSWELAVVWNLAYLVVAIVFVSGIESLLCSRMADRLAENRGTPFDPNKEFWGQGLVQVFVPLLNGFPHTGALARTATNIKLGAVTPLAGIFKCFLKLALAYFLAGFLGMVPMACIAGILMWVASNMVKPAEVKQVFAHNWFHIVLMIFTAVLVIVTDFLTGVLSAMVLYGVLFKFLDKPAAQKAKPSEPEPGELAAPGIVAALPFQRALVCLSRSEADAGLIRYAAMLSKLSPEMELRFIHVTAGPDTGTSQDQGRLTDELRAFVETHFTGGPRTALRQFETLGGPLVDRLLSYTAENQIDLMLVGHHTHTGRHSLARRLAMKAPCSVWLVPEGSHPTLQNILVPIDFSEHAADSMRVATAMAKQSRAHCHALHVYFNESVTTFEGYDQVIRGEEQATFQKFMQTIPTDGVQITPYFENAVNVPHAIQRLAEREHADLIVMATRGRSRSAAILLGSVTEQMIMETRLPLLAVKHFGARIEVLQALLKRLFRPQASLHTD